MFGKNMKQAYVIELLGKLDALLKKGTSCIIRDNLALMKSTFESGQSANNAAAATISQAERLISNLILGKEAAEYAQKKLAATNQTTVKNDKQASLNVHRHNINNVQLIKFFSKLMSLRGNMKNAEYEQTAFRKGTGTSIRLWAQYANTPGEKKPGNCTEQSNAAFAYLYTTACAEYAEKKQSPLDHIERIDVDNKGGGHVFLLIDRDQASGLVSSQFYSIDEFLQKSSDFGPTCVVVDPWNKENSVYPASDLRQKLPACALAGMANIEFRIGLADPEKAALVVSAEDPADKRRIFD